MNKRDRLDPAMNLAAACCGVSKRILIPFTLALSPRGGNPVSTGNAGYSVNNAQERLKRDLACRMERVKGCDNPGNGPCPMVGNKVGN